MAIIPTTTSELFGLKNFGTLLNLVSICNPVSAYFFSVQVAGRVYDMQAQNQAVTIGMPLTAQMRKRMFSRVPRIFTTNASDELLCNGALCFRLTFGIMALFCVAGAVAGFALYKRTRKFYQIDLFGRYNSLPRPDPAVLEEPDSSCKIQVKTQE
eukprot:TRINITY_DN8527_c0_g1_i1.p1 TRINITY_DN8527_c0_g1~~TRINITY_DN8527_c0_g1_i1.p1  ORF type:complete len:179 (+),score=5.13 TRINITY_DN8527_c0_g1_i1:73-537(+)